MKNKKKKKNDNEEKSLLEKELNKGFFTLKFSKEIEKKFKEYLYKQIKDSMRFSILLGIAIYFIFGLLDYIVYHDVYKTLFFYRYVIGGPPLVIISYLIMKSKTERRIQILFTLTLIVAGIVIIAMMFFLDDPTQRYYAGLTIVMLYAYIAVGLRFRYTLFIGWSLIALYFILALFIKRPDESFFISNFFSLIFFNLIGMISSFWYEKSQRKMFLLSSLVELEREELEKANKKLKELSVTDHLTKLPNRRYFQEFIEREWKRAVRYKEPISAIMVDIDFFKKYNDALGHQKGDIVLRKVANTLKRNIRRAGDLVARFGGEEFIIILGRTNEESAMKVAEKIRKAIEKLKIKHPDSSVSEFLTISLGVSSVIPIKGTSCENLIKAADEALYEAKKRGRNRVEKKEVGKA